VLRHIRVWCAAILISVGMAACAPPEEVSIQLADGVFRLNGWRTSFAEPAAGWASVFAIYTGTGDVPPLLGDYDIDGGTLVFSPQFPFEPGVRYRAVFRPPDGSASLEARFDPLDRDTTPVARVTAVYPTADVLPSNQLRVYIYFSVPMSRGEADDRIRVLDASGMELPGVLLPAEELWDRDNQRLTMTFDPGRIKRGLTSNEALGPPIEDGEDYVLVIDREWLDARGVPMVEEFRKEFRGGPALRTPPDPVVWTVVAPAAGTVDRLVVTFPVSMNYPLLQRMLAVEGPDGGVAGRVAVARNETEWHLTPNAPWLAGPHRLLVDQSLEDLAGNSIDQPFDIDVFERVTERIETSTRIVAFIVR
jgi:hypothetical protein